MRWKVTSGVNEFIRSSSLDDDVLNVLPLIRLINYRPWTKHEICSQSSLSTSKYGPKLKNMYAVQWDFTSYITKN